MILRDNYECSIRVCQGGETHSRGVTGHEVLGTIILTQKIKLQLCKSGDTSRRGGGVFWFICSSEPFRHFSITRYGRPDITGQQRLLQGCILLQGIRTVVYLDPKYTGNLETALAGVTTAARLGAPMTSQPGGHFPQIQTKSTRYTWLPWWRLQIPDST